MDNRKLHHIAFGIICCSLFFGCAMPADKASKAEAMRYYTPSGEQLDSAFTELYALRGIEGILDTNAVIVGNSEEMVNQYRQSVANLDGMLRSIARQVKQYDDQPVYWVELDRSGFHKILLELNGIPLAYAYTGKHPEFRIDLLNQYIEASGEQLLRIRAYTSRGDFFRGGDGTPTLRIGYSPDKRKGDDEPQYLTDYITLPDSIMDTGTQYWDTTITFHAQVPWDHSHRLQNAVDLRTLPDLEERVLRRYEELRQNFVNCDVAKDLLEDTDRLVNYYTCQYMDDYATIEEDIMTNVSYFEPNHPDKQVFPIEYYELAIYRDGKIAVLRKSNDKKGVIQEMIHVSDHDEPLVETKTSFMLYLPEGESELQVY